MGIEYEYRPSGWVRVRVRRHLESGDWQLGTRRPGDCDCSHPLPFAIPIPQISRAPVKPTPSRVRPGFNSIL